MELSDGASLPVTRGGMILVAKTSAILPTELGRDRAGFPIVLRWRTVALSHIVQFMDIDEPVSGKRPKKRK